MIKRHPKLTVALTAVLLVIVILLGYYILAVTNFRAYGSGACVDRDSGIIESDGESIRILQLSDVQTSNLAESAIAYPMVERVVRETEPDLIVLTGDNISNGSTTAVLDTFISFMDSFEIPWALVFGNHDIRSAVPVDEQCLAYESSEYCIFKKGDMTERYGNYSYTVKLGDTPEWSLVFMDSSDSSFTAEQVDWYERTVLSTDSGEGPLPGLAFFHIPIAETADAHAAYAADPTIGSGRQVSEPRTQSRETGFFGKVKELGATRALFYGHDHRNNTFINYDDIMFCYATKTGRTVYYERDSLGGNLITVGRGGSLKVERVHVG